MQRLKIRDSELMKIAVQQEIVRTEESRYDHRLHGILLACSGKSSYEIAELFNQSPRTVQYWIKRFEESGFAGLTDAERPGRPTAVDSSIQKSIGKDLRKSPRDFGYSQNLWDGKLLSFHLKKKHKVILGERQCRRMFHVMGFRRRKPRPLIAKSDPQVQEKYKKTSEIG